MCPNCADDKPFAFEAAVQSHVGIGHIRLAEALGLAGKMVLDCDSNPDKPWLHVSDDESTTFGGECQIFCVTINAWEGVFRHSYHSMCGYLEDILYGYILTCVNGAERRIDRVYIDAATEEKGFVMIHPGNDRYSLDLINRQGFRDLGLWNPHDDLPDPTMSQQFVAFSGGEIARPVRWVCFPGAWPVACVLVDGVQGQDEGMCTSSSLYHWHSMGPYWLHYGYGHFAGCSHRSLGAVKWYCGCMNRST